MGRGKLTLELIPKEKSRRLTFEKRKKGLMKKAHEFSILCGVDTCVIVYPDGESEPEVWPPEQVEVRRIIERYRREGPDRRSKRTTGLMDFFINKKKKLHAELKKVRTENWEAKYPVSDEINAGLSEEQMRSLLITLRGKLNVAKERLAAMKAAKLQEIAKTGMMVNYFYPNDSDQMYPDHLTSAVSHFIGQDPLTLQPMPDPSAIMYNSFEQLPFRVHGEVDYPIAHNHMEATPTAFDDFDDHPYSTLPENFQFSSQGSNSSMSLLEPDIDFPSDMAFTENVGQCCDGVQMQEPTISHQQMAPIWFAGATVEQQTTGVVQCPPMMFPYPDPDELLIDSSFDFVLPSCHYDTSISIPYD